MERFTLGEPDLAEGLDTAFPDAKALGEPGNIRPSKRIGRPPILSAERIGRVRTLPKEGLSGLLRRHSTTRQAILRIKKAS